MKTVIRITLLTLVIGIAFDGNSYAKTQTNILITPSALPGGPMPQCNPFSTPKCPTIR